MAYVSTTNLPNSAWSVLEALPLSIYIKDSNCRFIWLNQSAATAIGAGCPSEAIGKADSDYFESSLAQEWEREELNLIRTGKPVLDKREQENSKAAVITSKIRFADEQGRLGIIGVSKSINAEHELIRRDTLAIAGSQAGLWHADARTGSVWYSARWKEILGESDTTLQNEKSEFWDRVYPDDKQRICHARNTHVQNPASPYECEFRMRHPKRGWIWIRSRGQAVISSSGQLLEIAGSHSDVTTYKDNEELHEAILKMLPALVFLKDQDLRFSFVNKEVIRFFNRSREQIIGSTDNRVNDNKIQNKSFELADRQVLASKPDDPPLVIDREELFDQNRGENRILQTQKKLLLWPSREPQRHVLVIATDISKLVRELEARQHELERERNKFHYILDAVFSAGEDILESEKEDDACTKAALHLDEIARRITVNAKTGVMISLLTNRDGQPFIVSSPSLATGVFSEIAVHTVRPMFVPDAELDILPYVLQAGETEFVANSQFHPRCDQGLTKKHGIVSQLVIPLQTRSLKIGTLQIALGESPEKPGPNECQLLETIAWNLSIEIERHRRLTERTQKNRHLLRASQLAAYNAAGTTVIHGLKRNLAHFRILLDRTERDRLVRGCAPAYDFVKDCRRFADGWAQSFADQLTSAKTTPEDNYVNLFGLIKEVVDSLYSAGAFDGCRVEWQSMVDRSAHVPGSQLFLREMVSALLVNAVEAHAKLIRLQVDVAETILPFGGVSRKYVRTRVCDDGDGIAKEYQDQIGKFGWTSKKSRGHGVGLTIVSTFAESLEGGLFLQSGGKSVGDPETIFELILPSASIAL